MKIVKTFYRVWTESQLPVQAAALSFFSVLAIAPLLVLVIELVGFIPGFSHHSLLRNHLFDTITREVGAPVSAVLRSLVDAAYAHSQATSLAGSIVGWALIVFAATGFFATVQGALEATWKSKPTGGVLATIRDRGLAVVVVVVLAVAAGLWIAATSAMTAFTKALPGGQAAAGVAGEIVVEWIVLSLAIAIVFKVLPHAPLRWVRAFQGAAVTGALIVAGQFAIGWYLNRSTAGDAYGVSTATIALLLWIYYSSMLFMAGAALTRALSLELDSPPAAKGGDGASPNAPGNASDDARLDDRRAVARGDVPARDRLSTPGRT